MSLEQKITELTATIVALTQALGAVGAASLAQPAAPAAPVTPPAAPVVPATPPAGIVMPSPPSFAPAAPAAPAGAPFADTKGLIEYATAAYHELETKKGAGWGGGIQHTVSSLTTDGNINSITPDKFAAFYTAIEAMKA